MSELDREERPLGPSSFRKSTMSVAKGGRTGSSCLSDVISLEPLEESSCESPGFPTAPDARARALIRFSENGTHGSA